jgi:superfamily II DNA or RNA helicase
VVSIVPEYRDFGEYAGDRLAEKSTLEQLLLMDSELANYVHLSRYVGPLHPADLPDMRTAYDERFSDFIEERLSGVNGHSTQDPERLAFAQVRESVAELNKELATQTSDSIAVLSESAERLLTKHLRRQGLDPSQMELDHMSRDGTLYLLELYATAVQQEVYGDSNLLSELQTAIEEYQQFDHDDLVDSLKYPVLMVSLWENQREGLNEWLSAGRHGVLEMATATGKTVAGIGAIAHLCGVLPNHDFDVWGADERTEDASIAVIAHSNAILSQWEREIRDLLGLNVAGADTSGQPDDLTFSTGTVEFHTIHSLQPRYGGPPDKTYDLVICDEAHHYSNTSEGGFGAALNQIQTKALLGLSATLGREGGKKRQELESLLGEVVYTYSVEDAQEDGIIPDFEWTVHPTPLEASEADEWEEKTNRITNLFKRVRYSDRSTTLLRNLDVPFAEFQDLGDFIRAHKAANIERDTVPDSWENLHAAIMSRNMIRHRSRPKLDAAIDLAEEYLTAEGDGIKIVMFTMNIDMVEEIESQLSRVCDDVYAVHSKVESSSTKKDRTVRKRIDRFKAADNGVLIAPKLLDEGIDVPDAEVGINVAGTKTELQLIQRMGRILRRHADQRPHFHHYVAVPEDQHLDGIDDKAFAQQLHWVRELGERISQQPDFESAAIDPEIVNRAKRRGNELWAEELAEEESVETIDGPLNLQEIIDSISVTAANALLDSLSFDSQELSEQQWEEAMQTVRKKTVLAPSNLQQLWWLYPIYQDDPVQLKRLLTAAREKQTDIESLDVSSSASDSDESSSDTELSSSGSESAANVKAPPESNAKYTTGKGTSSSSNDGGSEKTNSAGQATVHGLDERDLKRVHELADVTPTKNAELCSLWGYESGSDLYGYLSETLTEYFERNENGLIVLNEAGKKLVSSTTPPT